MTNEVVKLAIRFEYIPWDSMLFERPVYELTSWKYGDMDEFGRCEQQLRSRENPYMVFAKIPVSEIATIHFLEEAGFRYIETQLHIAKRLDGNIPDLPRMDYSLATVADLPDILEMAHHSFETDRYSVDPLISKDVAGRRYANWIQSCFNRENYWLHIYKKSGQTLAFTLTKVENHKAYGLLGGVKRDFHSLGYGLYGTVTLLHLLYESGLKSFETSISAANTGIMNVDFFMQYRVKDVKVVMRKIYAEAGSAQ